MSCAHAPRFDMESHLTAPIVVVASYAALKGLFKLSFFSSIKPRVIFINIYRFLLALFICLLLRAYHRSLAFYLYFSALPTYFLDLPRIKRIHLPRRNKHYSGGPKAVEMALPVNVSLVSNTFLLYPVLFELLCEEKVDARGIFLFMAGEIWFSVYPILRFNRNRNFMLQFTEMMSFLAVSEALREHYYLTDLLFAACAAVQFANFVFCSIPKHWYANCLSIINFMCGMLAIVYQMRAVSSDKPQYYVLAWVLAGQFFDLFDGRAAEHFGSTKNGEMFDDVADFTSFGLASGMLVGRCVYQTFHASLAAAWGMGVFYVVAVAYRLVRFVVNKRKAGQKGGVRVFEGLPSPGTSAIVLSITCLLQSFMLKYPVVSQQHKDHLLYGYIATVVFVCIVTVSHISYAHFGRVFSNKKLFNPTLRTIVCVAYVYFLLLSITRKNMDYIVAYMATCMMLYLLSPITMPKMYTNIRQYERENIAITSEDEQTGDE